MHRIVLLSLVNDDILSQILILTFRDTPTNIQGRKRKCLSNRCTYSYASIPYLDKYISLERGK